MCRMGSRSAQVTAYLVNHGWDNVRNLDGGMEDWAAGGRPVVSEDGTPSPRDLNQFHRWAPTPLVFAHRGSSAVLPEHTLRRIPARARRGRRRAGVRRPADPRRAPRVRARPPPRPHEQRPRPGQRAHAGRAGHPRLRLVGRPAGGLRLPARPRPGAAAHPRPAVGRRTGRRPAGPAPHRDQTPHPYGSDVERRLVGLLRRYGLADPGPDDAVKVTVMSFSPLAVRRIRELAPDLPTALLLEVLPPGPAPGPAAVRRQDRRPPASTSCGPARSWCPRSRPAATRCTCGPSTRPHDVDLAVEQGVDGIITDRPGFVLGRLGRSPS